MRGIGIFLVVSIIILIISLYINISIRGIDRKYEISEFGTSPGTLVQLASSHVPTERDMMEYAIEKEQVRKDIYNMTESDLY